MKTIKNITTLLLLLYFLFMGFNEAMEQGRLLAQAEAIVKAEAYNKMLEAQKLGNPIGAAYYRFRYHNAVKIIYTEYDGPKAVLERKEKSR